ncbi:hypothetical protein ACWD7F_15985 [Streptomyces sp. NPDC005122]
MRYGVLRVTRLLKRRQGHRPPWKEHLKATGFGALAGLGLFGMDRPIDPDNLVVVTVCQAIRARNIPGSGFHFLVSHVSGPCLSASRGSTVDPA